ncbi:hypothetical protein SUGI_0547540 [Cryptomeria japonica]|nr:hypothetical protein SUGI_0547540 [Cryptomeria japonica]
MCIFSIKRELEANLTAQSGVGSFRYLLNEERIGGKPDSSEIYEEWGPLPLLSPFLGSDMSTTRPEITLLSNNVFYVKLDAIGRLNLDVDGAGLCLRCSGLQAVQRVGATGWNDGVGVVFEGVELPYGSPIVAAVPTIVGCDRVAPMRGGPQWQPP